MLGTFGLRPKATLRARALAMAQALSSRHKFTLITAPWDSPEDAGKHWDELGAHVVNTRWAQPARFPLAVTEMIASRSH